MLTEEEINALFWGGYKHGNTPYQSNISGFRAIESAATAPLLEEIDRLKQRCAELEKWQADHWVALETINQYLVSKDKLVIEEDGGPIAAARNVVRSIAKLEKDAGRQRDPRDNSF